MTNKNQSNQCWICESDQIVLVKPSNIDGNLKSDSFAITDSAYGVTSALEACLACGFVQSADLTEVLNFYENLKDPSYEENRAERSLQSRKILDVISQHKGGGTLFDIGAGTGMLVEQALNRGYEASGVEPSKWLAGKAQEYNLPVKLGTFPEIKEGPYDLITLIDVIEHVNNPLQLLRDINSSLLPGGMVAVITPDLGSFIARILKFKWWHFRVAHIGYFNKKTLHNALEKAGFEKVYFGKAKWYFASDYLIRRALKYLPTFPLSLKINWGGMPLPKFLSRITVPLNLGDSIFAIYRKPLL